MVPSPLHRHPEFGRFGPDKLLHFVGHAGLTTSFLHAAGTERHTTAVLAVGSSTAYSVFLNILQRWVPGRKPERADVVAGFLGSVVAVAWQQMGDVDRESECR